MAVGVTMNGCGKDLPKTDKEVEADTDISLEMEESESNIFMKTDTEEAAFDVSVKNKGNIYIAGGSNNG